MDDATLELELFLSDLPTKLATAKAADLRALKVPASVALTESKISDAKSQFTLKLPARDVAWFTKRWKLVRPIAASHDVHQRSFSIGLYDGDVADPYNQRIATKAIQFGAWIVEPILEARPSGKLPAVMTGASPAYDMTTYSGRVVTIVIRPA